MESPALTTDGRPSYDTGSALELGATLRSVVSTSVCPASSAISSSGALDTVISGPRVSSMTAHSLRVVAQAAFRLSSVS